MKSFRDRNPYVVGLVSVLVIALLTGAAFAVGTFHLLEDTYEMEGVFVDASGLKAGDDVRVAGVKVGRVTDIGVDRDQGNVIVTWVVNSGVALGQETSAEIALASLLGSKELHLSGPVDEPFLEDLDREERVIPLERTKVPFDVFELARIGTEGIQELNTGALNSIVTDLADITEDKRQSVTSLVDGIDAVAGAINERSAQLAQLLDRADTVAATLAEKDETLVQLVDASREILELIAARRDELAVALGEGSAAVSELTRIILENETSLDRILKTLDPTLDTIAAHQEELDTSLAWLGPGFLQQTQAGTHGPWLEIFVRTLAANEYQLICSVIRPELSPAECDALAGGEPS